MYFSTIECTFSNGYYVESSREKLVSVQTNTAKECAIKVKKEKISAIGATWASDGTRNCYAHFGAGALAKTSHPREACLFRGRSITSAFYCQMFL